MKPIALASSLALLASTALSPSRPAPAPGVYCARPGALRLVRFEDRSAQLLCGRRILVRVHVPG